MLRRSKATRFSPVLIGPVSTKGNLQFSDQNRKIKMPEVALKKVNDCIPVDSNSVYQDTKLMETIEGWSFVHQG